MFENEGDSGASGFSSCVCVCVCVCVYTVNTYTHAHRAWKPKSWAFGSPSVQNIYIVCWPLSLCCFIPLFKSDYTWKELEEVLVDRCAFIPALPVADTFEVLARVS